MTIGLLLDTDIVSYVMKNHEHAALYEDILASNENLLISVQTEAELLFGALNGGWGPRRMSYLRQVIAKYRTLPIDRDTGAIWANIQARSKAAGKQLSAEDAWIAATAIRFEVPLVAHDKHYIPMDGLTLIRRR